MRVIVITILISCSLSAAAQHKLSFGTLAEVFSYADAHSNVFKNASQENILAKYQILAAKFQIWNLKSDVNFSVTDNTKLVTTFIPAEVFGGPQGSFSKVTFGQQYVSNLNIGPQIDLLNLNAIAKVKTARANEQLIHFDHQLSKQTLYENLAAAFYNIVSCKRQLSITQNSLLNSDTLTRIMRNRFNEGAARSQDVNNAIANGLLTKDKLQQIEVQLQDQYNTLKILCDIDTNTGVEVEDVIDQQVEVRLEAEGKLLQKRQEWQKSYQQTGLNTALTAFLPTLSFFSSFAFQQNTSKIFFDNSPWFSSNYIGLRITFPLVPDVNKLFAVKNARINIIIADNDLQHARLQDEINNMKLGLNYKKAISSYHLSVQIEALKRDSYFKNLNIYKEGLLSATDLISALNEWYGNSLNTAVQFAASAYAKACINIANEVK